MPGLKRNAHSAAGDLAEDLVFTEVADAGRLGGAGLRRPGDPSLTVASRICLFGLDLCQFSHRARRRSTMVGAVPAD